MGASSVLLGTFSDETAAYNFFRTKVFKDVEHLNNMTYPDAPDYSKLKGLLVGTSKDMFTALDKYRMHCLFQNPTRSRLVNDFHSDPRDLRQLEPTILLATAPFAEPTEVEVDN